MDLVLNNGEARFLRRKSEKGPWLVLTKEQAILKACQVMRDYKRPDRIAQRQMMAANGQARKRVRQVESTPLPEDYVSTDTHTNQHVTTVVLTTHSPRPVSCLASPD